jgi:hypothetical protein
MSDDGDKSALLDILGRNLIYQTPTPVIEEGKTVRYNVTMHASDYERMMGIVTASNAVVVTKADRLELMRQFAAKARGADGAHDLTAWSLGEVKEALEDTLEFPEELAGFRAALIADLRRRTQG